jgi:hypothetical protein
MSQKKSQVRRDSMGTTFSLRVRANAS